MGSSVKFKKGHIFLIINNITKTNTPINRMYGQ